MNDVYVCMKAKDMPEPYVPCLKGKCKKCGEEVFYSKYAYENDAYVRKIIDSGEILCVDCATKVAKASDSVAVTEATISEVADYFSRKGEAA